MKTRVEELRQKIRDVTGENPIFGGSPNCPVEVEEALLEHVLAFETSPKCTLIDFLEQFGVLCPPPKALTARALTAKLWEIIDALLSRSIVLGNTDHLSDRALYTRLWNETLRDEFVLCPHCTIHIDMSDTSADDGPQTYLKYYANDAQRTLYAEVYPDLKMPKHVEPPRRRDHLIPDVPPPAVRKAVN